MEQPRWDDDVLAWRRYAGELRQRLGAMKRSAAAVTADLRMLHGEHRRLLTAHRHLGRRMDTLARILLDDGDVAAAANVLATRRARIAAARSADS